MEFTRHIAIINYRDQTWEGGEEQTKNPMASSQIHKQCILHYTTVRDHKSLSAVYVAEELLVRASLIHTFKGLSTPPRQRPL